MYDRQGSTYLFDLDYVEDVYTVDAAHQGNISHFVNHSVSVQSILQTALFQQEHLLNLGLCCDYCSILCLRLIINAQ